jgi:hypothetical protein
MGPRLREDDSVGARLRGPLPAAAYALSLCISASETSKLA